MATLELTPAQTRTIAGQYQDDLTAEINRLKRRNETLEASVSELTSQLDSVEHDRDHFKREAVEAAGKLAVIEQALKGEPDKWDCWSEVPDGITYWSERQKFHRWVNRAGVRYCFTRSGQEVKGVADEYTMQLRAPFVRAN